MDATTTDPQTVLSAEAAAPPRASGVPMTITVLLAIIGVLGVFANILLLIALLTKKSRKVTSNYYLVNLAIADFMVSIMVPVRIIDYELGVLHWSAVTCRLQTFVRYWPVYLTINTMLLIAVERHVAVVRPLIFKQFVSKGNVLMQLTITWIISGFEVTYLVVESLSFKGTCNIIRRLADVHFVYMTIIAMPSVLLLGIYGHLFYVAKKRSRVQPAGDGQQQAKASSNSQKAVQSAKMLLLCAVLFIVCWTPTMSLYYEVMLNFNRFVTGPGKLLFQMSSLLIFGHSIMNPITYLAMSATFRRTAKEFFLTCLGREVKRTERGGVFSVGTSADHRKTDQTDVE